ncbi:MAG: 3-deoxy-D-manno-octulosonic acid transferase [Candidatus Omnitrophota bacterium]
MFILYDFIFLAVALVHLPLYLFKRKFHSGFWMRLGVLPRGLNLNNPVWIHAVSVGEVMAVKNLLAQLRAASADKKFFITTVTSTGNKIAKAIAKDTDFVGYLPFDFSFIVRSVMDRIKPSLFIIAETEIWPNLITCLYRKGVPVILVNGRISDRSFKGYLAIKFLLKPVLNKISLFCVQTPSDAQRLRSLGVPGDKIKETGNMKFDNTGYADKNISGSADKYRALLELKEGEKLWVCGSTHPGEEETILDVYQELIAEFPKLKLLIAPRHPERAGEIENALSRYGFRAGLVSALPFKPCACVSRPVFILDVIGELIYFYNIADMVFVGGSLVKKGGHNILEPASAGKPVLIGPHTFNFRDIVRLFLDKEACIVTHNREGLLKNIKELLNNPDIAGRLSQRAKLIISENKGATARNLGYIRDYLR